VASGKEEKDTMRNRSSSYRRWLGAITLAVALALVLVIAPGSNRAGAQDSASVDIADFTFGPGSVTITAGATVTWTNSDSAPHTATGDGGAFDTGTIDPGGSASITFDTPGTYTYICSIHPDMTGTVVVVAAGDDGGEDDGGADDGVNQLPDTGTGMASSGQSTLIGTIAAVAMAIALGALAIRRRPA
jgi:plastocyanin